MIQTRKRFYRRNSKKNKKNKKRTKRIKRIRLKIKNLGKKRKTYKRIQYGCQNSKIGGKNYTGGGPIFQPLTDFIRNSQASSQNFFNTFHGNDSNTNEVISSRPLDNESNYYNNI